MRAWFLPAFVALLGCTEGADGRAADVPGGDVGADVASDALPDPAPDAWTETAPDATSEATPDLPTGVPGGSPLPTALAGWVRVTEETDETGKPSYSRVEAELRSGPLPSTQVEVDRVGDCVLLVGDLMNRWECDPMCEWGEEACVGKQCVPYPAPAPAGRITISGLAAAIRLSPDATGRYAAVYEAPADLFAAGAEVRASSEGGATPAFDLAARGVADFHPDMTGFDVRPGQDGKHKDGVIRWDPPPGGPASGTRVYALIQTGWHGSPSLTTIWCDASDDGDLVVDASLLERFPIPSCGECEGSYVGRYTQANLDFGAGPVQLFVASRRWFVAWWK